MQYMELEVLPACRACGVGFVCWSPLTTGILAGSAGEADAGRRTRLNLSEAQVAWLREYEAPRVYAW